MNTKRLFQPIIRIGVWTLIGLPAESDLRLFTVMQMLGKPLLAALNLKRANFHGEWNYKLLPFRKK